MDIPLSVENAGCRGLQGGRDGRVLASFEIAERVVSLDGSVDFEAIHRTQDRGTRSPSTPNGVDFATFLYRGRGRKQRRNTRQIEQQSMMRAIGSNLCCRRHRTDAETSTFCFVFGGMNEPVVPAQDLPLDPGPASRPDCNFSRFRGVLFDNQSLSAVR